MDAPQPTPEDALSDLIEGPPRAHVVRAFVELGLADHLGGEPRSPNELAREVGAHGPSLARFLAAAASLGLCRSPDGSHYTSSPITELVKPDDPDSMAAWALLLTSPWLVRPWENLGQAIRSGGSTFSQTHGVGFWEYVAAHPEEGSIFDSAMTNGAKTRGSDVVRSLDLSRVRTVVDVGGGQGMLVAQVVEQVPGLIGIAADRPEVVEGGLALLEGSEIAQRVRLVACDFFKEVPTGGDLYLLSRILHDWPDEEAVAILATCRKSMRPDGRLCILEQVAPNLDSLSPEERTGFALKDLNMLVLVGGKERTADEYEELLVESGFVLLAIHQGTDGDLIEAAPR